MGEVEPRVVEDVERGHCAKRIAPPFHSLDRARVESREAWLPGEGLDGGEDEGLDGDRACYVFFFFFLIVGEEQVEVRFFFSSFSFSNVFFSYSLIGKLKIGKRARAHLLFHISGEEEV